MEEGEEKRTNNAFDVALAPILPPVYSLPFISSFLAPSGVFPEVSLLLLRASFSYYCEIGFHFPPFFCLFFFGGVSMRPPPSTSQKRHRNPTS